jgi:DNA primase
MSQDTFRNYVESVRTTADLAQVVGEVVSLRRAGRGLTGLCPFHQEKTPSFHVDTGKGLFYCFGCGAGGGAFDFVMRVHGLEFVEAVHHLADRYGISRPAPSRGDADSQQKSRRERIAQALTLAHEWFVGRLNSEAGAGARRYLSERGLDSSAQHRLGLGFAPASWDGLLRHLTRDHQFEVTELAEAGLVVPASDGSQARDRFRGRVIFPIRDSAGRLVSFAGRSFDGTDPKYINGPETSFYDKGRTLYRLHEAGPAMRRSGRGVVVEGYFDAMSLAAAGVEEVVAVCGTALGEAHAKLLRRWAPQVVLFLDSDEAGRRAVHRALPVLLAEGLAVRIAACPAGTDPDDLARKQGQGAVEAVLSSADDLPAFLVREARRSFDLSALDGRVAAMEMILGHLAMLDSELTRADAADRVAEGLGWDDELVRRELSRAARRRQRTVRATALNKTNKISSRAVGLNPAEAVLLRYLTSAAAAGESETLALLEMLPEDLSGLADAALGNWRAAKARGVHWGIRELAESLPESDRGEILALGFHPGDEPCKATAHAAVIAIRCTALKAQQNRIQERLKNGGLERSEEFELAGRKLALQHEIARLEGVAPADRSQKGTPPKGGQGKEVVF